MTASPYWPEPPVCRTNLPWIFSAGSAIVSRYATCGRPTFASTLNSRFRRSTMISRCSSPIPEMSVCPVSSSVSTRKVGSSSASRARPLPSLSWSAFDFGSTATEMTGLGERHRLEHDRRRLDRERVAGRRRLEADAGGDLARADLLALLAVVRVHLEDAADALGLAGRRVQDAVAGLQLAGVDAEVRELADVRVGHHLEGERRERLVERRLALELVAPSSGPCPGSPGRRAGSAGSRSRRRAAAARPCS